MGGRVPTCLHLVLYAFSMFVVRVCVLLQCLVPLVLCPGDSDANLQSSLHSMRSASKGFWISDIIGSCQMISVVFEISCIMTQLLIM